MEPPEQVEADEEEEGLAFPKTAGCLWKKKLIKQTLRQSTQGV